MKHLPLLLLGLMAVLFAMTQGRPEAWAGWVSAFAEAGMVGALADWFAVVALFRHPLGLPIPHTAIIPNRKDAIGDNLAQFVAGNFLDPGVVRGRLDTVNLAEKAAHWLKSPAGQERVKDIGTRLAAWLLGALHEARVRDFIARLATRQLADVEVAPALGRALDWLVRGGRHQDLLTDGFRASVVLLHEHRETIRSRVQQESPWWVPGFIDDRVVVQMLDRVEGLLLELSLDHEHALRGDFDRWAVRWAESLQNDPAYRRWGARLKDEMLGNAELQDYLYRLWADIAAALEADLARPDSAFREEVGRSAVGLAEELERDPGMQAWVNAWVTDLAVGLVGENREAMASLISETVRGWDAQDTSRRIEQAIGRDLQYIRINGTLVGGLVGLLIHALVTM